MHFRYVFISVFSLLVVLSCSKPVTIGSEFLDDEKASLNFVDYFDLSFYTEPTDSIIVHSNNTSRQLFSYLCGTIDEPVFGKSTAEIYCQPLLPGIATVLRESTLDSVVLQLRYDSLNSYGDLHAPVTIEVYRMMENPEFVADYYSNKQFATSPDLLGSLTFVPADIDSITIIRPDDTTKVGPGIRIPLDVMKMAELTMQDTNTLSNQDSFLNYFNGLYIKMPDATNTMVSFNLVNTVTGLSYYYDKATVQDQEFRFVITSGSVKTVHMEHDYTGSMVGAALGPDPETDLTYMQGLSGVRTKMVVQGLDTLGDAIINQAQMEIFCSFPDGDLPDLYSPAVACITQELDAEDGIINSEDVMVALGLTGSSTTTASYFLLYGGQLTEVEAGPPAVYRYNMNVTLQFKSIYKGDKENTIYFNPFAKGNLANRSVIYGPDHPTYAPRLRVAYTKINQ